MALTTLFVAVAIVLSVITAVLQRQKLPKGIKELPGPKGWPIIGNMLEIPSSHHWVKFKELADQYGPIFKLDIFGTTHVVISNAKMADDLMAMKGAIYSDRGNLYMINLLTGSHDVLCARNNSYWRRARKFAGAVLTPKEAAIWEPFQQREAQRLAAALVQSPDRYQYWFERFSTAVSVREAYGHNFTSKDDEQFHVHTIQMRMHHLERFAAPGKYLVELFPWLMYVPKALAPFKQEADRLHKSERAYFASLLSEAQQKYQDGVPENPPSFSRRWLQADDHWDLSFDEMVYVTGTMYGGGAGTTSGAMKSWIRAMVLYPEWLHRLQAELDEVVGPDRVPEFADLPRLPTVRAAIKETLRWSPVIPGNMPHRLSQDDYYNGYYLPKGALVHGNQWAINRDESQFSDPETYNPSRWLEPESQNYKEPLDKFPNLKRDTAFGWGRRICPGLETAQRSLSIMVATIAWAADIAKTKDSSGRDIDIAAFDMENDSLSFPKDFPFSMKVRDDKRLQLLQAEIGKSKIAGFTDTIAVYE